MKRTIVTGIVMIASCFGLGLMMGCNQGNDGSPSGLESASPPPDASPPKTADPAETNPAEAPVPATVPSTADELQAMIRAANPDYTGKGKIHENDEDGIWGIVIKGCGVSTLAPLRGLRLTLVACADNDIRDLSPLKGMELLQFDCRNNPIVDLMPIAGMPISRLGIMGTKVTDLTPLEGMELKWLVFSPDKIETGLDVVRNMKSIESYPSPDQPYPPEGGLIALIKAETFWELYDERHGKK